jgi:hypothetical protein
MNNNDLIVVWEILVVLWKGKELIGLFWNG